MQGNICGSLCIEILNADSELLCKIAEELCAVMNKPEILLKDYRSGKSMRFEEENCYVKEE